MSTNIPTEKILRIDRGSVNARILARSSRADFRRVEAASLKIEVIFTSAEAKRYYLRFFHTMQLNAHFISLIARTRLDEKEISAVETVIRKRLDAAAEAITECIDGADALFAAHAISRAASYDTVPLKAEVMVVSSLGRRFLECLQKLDQLMPLLQTLEIFEIIDGSAASDQRSKVKMHLRKVAVQTRSLAIKLRVRMDELDARPNEVAGADTASQTPAAASTVAADGEREFALERDVASVDAGQPPTALESEAAVQNTEPPEAAIALPQEQQLPTAHDTERDGAE
jgi:hypothetical protein